MKVRLRRGRDAVRKMAMALAAASMLIMLVQCNTGDTRGIPDKIIVKAKVASEYHIHIRVLFEATNSTLPFCNGVFGESPNTSETIYNDISATETEVEIKKYWDGLCDYKFELMVIACTRTNTFPQSRDISIQTAIVGVHDSVEPDIRKLNASTHSKIRFLNNALNIRVKGSDTHFWGCDSNCENSDKFGIDNQIETLSIDCREEE